MLRRRPRRQRALAEHIEIAHAPEQPGASRQQRQQPERLYQLSSRSRHEPRDGNREGYDPREREEGEERAQEHGELYCPPVASSTCAATNWATRPSIFVPYVMEMKWSPPSKASSCEPAICSCANC